MLSKKTGSEHAIGVDRGITHANEDIATLYYCHPLNPRPVWKSRPKESFGRQQSVLLFLVAAKLLAILVPLQGRTQ